MAIVTIYIVLIFPIFLSINLEYSQNIKLLRYQIKLFGLLSIFGGYVELVEDGIVIHLSKRKAVLIFYKDLVSMRKKFEPLKDYHIFKLKTDVYIGLLDYEAEKINFATLYTIFFNIIGQYASQYKSYVTLNNNIYLFEKDNFVKFIINTTFVFNILMIIISIIKIILEKIIYAIKIRSQPNK